MQIRNLNCVVYDIEVFINCFHCTCYNTETLELHKFELSERKDEMQQMLNYFLQKDIILVGYNNIHYDNVIVNYCIEYFNNSNLLWSDICKSISKLSNTIISKTDNVDLIKRWKFAKNFKTLDLLTLLYSKALRVSLKEMQVTMMYPKVQDFVMDWRMPIMYNMIDDMIDYNINDVMSTTALLERCEKDILLRIAIEDDYHIECLSKDGVNIGMEILKQEYLAKTRLNWFDIKNLRSPIDFIKLSDVILPFVKYKSAVMQKMLTVVSNTVVDTSLLDEEETSDEVREKSKFKYNFLFDNLEYTVGVGGLHSVNQPGIIVPEENEIFADIDVASLYPSMIIEHGFYPPHLGKEFVIVYSEIKDKRIAAKHAGLKTKDLTLKLALNGLTGNLQNKYSWCYSPFAVMQIRINGQLLLLMLAEALVEAGVTIVQANTDGLFIKYDKSLLDKVTIICKEWEQLTKLVLEERRFKAMYQYAINDYLAIPESGTPAEKGIFITETRLGKGLTPRVIPKAIQAYFLYGTPVKDFIKNSTDINDFLMSEKTGKQWTVEYNFKDQQRTNRFYASTNGYYLWKYRTADADGMYGPKKKKVYYKRGTKYGYQNMLSASGITLLNTFDNIPIEARKINYNYYITEASKIIYALKTKQLELF